MRATCHTSSDREGSSLGVRQCPAVKRVLKPGLGAEAKSAVID